MPHHGTGYYSPILYAIGVLLRILLYLWRVLPLSARLRWLIMWRGNAHFMAGAAALIRDDAGRVLLFKHTYRRRHPWGLPGGWIGRDEKLEEAVMRELREESGLEVVVERLALADLEVRYRRIDLLYMCRIVGGAFRPSPEVSARAYFPLEALPDMMPEQRRLIMRALSAEA